MDEKIKSRLNNWKFQTALNYLATDANCTDNELELITALARVFGNVGWFEGDMSTIVSAALQTLLRGNQEVTQKHCPSCTCTEVGGENG